MQYEELIAAGVIVDDEDKHLLESGEWCVWSDRGTKRGRARDKLYVSRVVRSGGKVRQEYLHRVLLSARHGQMVDHENGDTLDNRRGNIRLATATQNGRNKVVQRNNSSGFKGVSRVGERWHAYVCVGRKQTHLGIFDTREAAAVAYNVAAARLFGEFARLNDVFSGEAAA